MAVVVAAAAAVLGSNRLLPTNRLSGDRERGRRKNFIH